VVIVLGLPWDLRKQGTNAPSARLSASTIRNLTARLFGP